MLYACNCNAMRCICTWMPFSRSLHRPFIDNNFRNISVWNDCAVNAVVWLAVSVCSLSGVWTVHIKCEMFSLLRLGWDGFIFWWNHLYGLHRTFLGICFSIIREHRCSIFKHFCLATRITPPSPQSHTTFQHSFSRVYLLALALALASIKHGDDDDSNCIL